MQTMQELYERRQAKLEYYRQQYEQQPRKTIYTGSTGSEEDKDEIDCI